MSAGQVMEANVPPFAILASLKFADLRAFRSGGIIAASLLANPKQGGWGFKDGIAVIPSWLIRVKLLGVGE